MKTKKLLILSSVIGAVFLYFVRSKNVYDLTNKQYQTENAGIEQLPTLSTIPYSDYRGNQSVMRSNPLFLQGDYINTVAGDVNLSNDNSKTTNSNTTQQTLPNYNVSYDLNGQVTRSTIAKFFRNFTVKSAPTISVPTKPPLKKYPTLGARTVALGVSVWDKITKPETKILGTGKTLG